MTSRERPVACVTGSASGLAWRVARDLALEDGYDVVLNYVHHAEKAEQLAATVRERGGRALVVQADVSNPSEVDHLFDFADAELGGVDVLVHGAGPFIFASRPLLETTPAEWREMIDGNLSSAYYAARRVLPGMRARRGGRLIFFGYTGALAAESAVQTTAYSAAKVGLLSLTRSLARSEAPYGVTANMIGPGVIEDGYKEKAIREARGVTAPRIPVGRPGTGEDVSRVVRFLCAPDSDFLTGNVIYVSGGWHI